MILYNVAMDSLLVISDEPALAETLASELAGVNVEQARFAESSARLAEKRHGAILIDEGGPDNSPMLANMDAIVIRLTRPAALSELLYTIRERLQGKSAGSREELALGGGLRLCPNERMLRFADDTHPIPLTEKETELLSCLLKAQGHALQRDQLLKSVWGYSDDIATHTLETHIYRLRGKLKQTGRPLDIIFSEDGGYRLELGGSAA